MWFGIMFLFSPLKLYSSVLISFWLISGCAMQRPYYSKSFTPPPPAACRNIDLGPSAESFGQPIKLTEDEKAQIERLKSRFPKDVEIDPFHRTNERTNEFKVSFSVAPHLH